MASLTASLFNEQKERERRELNLIVHNMLESTASEGAGRKKDDIMKVTSVMKDNIKVKPTISNAIRLGKKGSDKPCLLKITVSSIEEKVAILRTKVKLRADLTPLEQRKNKALRQQLRELNKEEKIYRIKNGEIVRRRL